VKFVLVNGRTPYPQTFCMLRCESIKSGYLRATTTQYPYCDYECYSLYCEIRGAVARGSRGRRTRCCLWLPKGTPKEIVTRIKWRRSRR
jgi:hypothetical protein